jgi:hypothetical protein
MITPTFKADLTDLRSSIIRYSGVSQKTLRESFLRAMRGVVKRAMGITPPGNSIGELGTPRGEGGGLTSADKARGDNAIVRDLINAFTAVDLKHLRKETTPDVAAKHRELFIKYKKPGRPLTRGRRQAYYVDRVKLKALLHTLEGNVGRLASGWLSGAQALGVTGTPAWVSKHGASRGQHRLILELFNYQLEVSNNSVPDDLVPELERRLTYAISYANNAMTRETEYILKRGARDSGFQTD